MDIFDLDDTSLELTKHETTVFLVDDQPIVGEAIRRMLARESDMNFHYCKNPLDAIQMANEISPTVILQDLFMPEMDGMTLVGYFRANPSTKDVPMIVLSSNEDSGVKAEAFAAGANDYLVKLPDKAELIARVRYHSKNYINLLERDEAFLALTESRKQLEIRNRFIRETFGRYLSDDVVDNLLETPDGLNLGGEKRIVTIMMADLRGFSSYAERLPPDKVVSFLNTFLETMTEIIFKYSGTIDEIIGDALLVIFGAPILRPDDAERAAACAVEMQLAMQEVNEKNEQEGLPELEMGIGLNTGAVVVGNIGSKKRSKYGVVGKNVNLTARIESCTIGGQILISEKTLDAVGAILKTDDKMEIFPKGSSEPISIFELTGIDGQFELHLPGKKQAELFTPITPVPVRFSFIEGKQTGQDLFEGEVIRLSVKVVEIRSSTEVDRLDNLKLSFVAEEGEGASGDVYGKVTDLSEEGESTFSLNLTFVSPEARTYIANIIQAFQA